MSTGGLGSQHAPPLDIPARFFALSAIAWTAVALLAPVALPLLAGGFYSPPLLAFVHLNTLGIVGAVLMGASYQLVPVVLQTTLAWPNAARASFWALLGGLCALLHGLYGGGHAYLAAAGLLLLAGFALHLAVIARTLAGAPTRDGVTMHVAVSAAFLLAGVALGVTLAFNRVLGFLGGALFRVLEAHVVLMIGGWIGIMLTGVSYRLISMFTLTEDRLRPSLVRTELALSGLGTVTLALSALFGGSRAGSIGGAAMLLLGLGIWALQLVILYRHRRRRTVDVHMPFAIVAVAAALTATVALLSGAARGEGLGAPVYVAAVWLAVAGMAQTSIFGFFLKISTFLVWLKRYAPLAGRTRVPRLEDMYDRRLAWIGLAAWVAALLCGLLALRGPAGRLATAAGLLETAGIVAFLVNVGSIARHLLPSTVGPHREQKITPCVRGR
jgi:hypothetical protein